MTTSDNIHPFEVIYDPDEQEYCIFAPEGCVLVNGVAVQIVDAEDGNVVLDLDPESLPDCLYAHVTEDSSATGGYKVEFDGESTKSGAKWNFRVARFGVGENDGNQYDIATSVVSLWEGAIPPFTVQSRQENNTSSLQIYLPDLGKLVMYGESYISTIGGVTAIQDGWYTVPASSGDIYLVVTVPATGNPTATIAGSPSSPSSGEKVYNVLIANAVATGDVVGIKQFVAGAVLLDGKGEDPKPVVPDGVSTEFIPPPAEGEEPTGDEGKLQIKGFASGTPAASYTIADYLMTPGTSASDGSLILRSFDGDGHATLTYLPLDTLDLSGSIVMSITQTPVSPTTDHPGGGVKLTFQLEVQNVPVGQPTEVTLWNGTGGGGGGTDLSDTNPLDCVLSTGNASPGVAVTASRSDHVHKLPNTVVDTINNQIIDGFKQFLKSVVIHDASASSAPSLYVGPNTAGAVRTRIAPGAVYLYSAGPAIYFYMGSTPPTSPTASIMEIAVGVLQLSGHARLALAPLNANETGYNSLQIATTGWVYDKIKDGTLTIKQGSSTLGTFSANQSTNTTVNIPEPPTPTAPGDGTLTITIGSTSHTFTANQSTNTSVTIPTPPAKATNKPADAVLSTGTAVVGSSDKYAAEDHVHKLPNTVVDTENPQVVGGAKTFTRTVKIYDPNAQAGDTPPVLNVGQTGGGTDKTRVERGIVRLYLAQPQIAFHFGKAASATASITETSAGILVISGHPRIGSTPINEGASGYDALQVASTGWVYGLRKTLIAGEGIELTTDAGGNNITISATNPGGGTSGYTGTRAVVAETRYNVSQRRLEAKYHRETWVNGVMTACTTDSSFSAITGGQAVEETI